MPAIRTVFYKEEDGSVPAREWILSQPTLAQDRIYDRIRRLRAEGNDLRPPLTEHLGLGIYYLRAVVGRVNYRVFYFFHGPDLAVLCHAITKEGKAPPSDIQLAVARQAKFAVNPKAHTYER